MKKILIISLKAQVSNINRTRTVLISNAINSLGDYSIDFATSEQSIVPDYINHIYYLKTSKLRKQLKTIYVFLTNFIESKAIRDTSRPSKSRFYPIYSETKSLKNVIHHFLDFFVEPFLNRSLKLKNYDYDLVFSSYEPWTNHTVAKRIVKKIRKSKTVIWVQDYRDPVIQSTTPILLRPILFFMIRRMTLVCDLITFVAPFKSGQLGFHENTPSYMLENGFDTFISKPLTTYEIKEHELDNDSLKLIYAGALYPGRSDLSPIFNAIELLITQNKLQANKISFYYYGNSRVYFENHYKDNGLFKILSFDNIDREYILSIYKIGRAHV